MNSLKFSDLRRANLERIPQYRNRKGHFVHSRHDGSDYSPEWWLQAVAGELGEYANIRKKHTRGDYDDEEFLQMARDELADVAIYLDLLALQFGIDLDGAIVDKFNRRSREIGSSVFLAPV